MYNFPGELTPMGMITNDYSKFEMHNLNRVIKGEKLEALKKNLNHNAGESDYPFSAPIVVYWEEGKGVIQQGHHRFLICKEQNRKIAYVITNCDRSPAEGQWGQDWAVEDYVYSFSNEKFEGFPLLQKMKREFPHYSLIALTTFINGKPTSASSLKKKKFVLISDNQTEVYKKAKKRIKKFEEFQTAAQRSDKSKEVIRALIEASESFGFDWGYFIKRTRANANEVKRKPEFSSISKLATAKALITFYYNYNSRNDQFISN